MNALIGLLLGAAVGLFGFVSIRKLADRIAVARPDDAGQRTARLLRSTAVVDLILFIVVGGFVGWYFFPTG